MGWTPSSIAAAIGPQRVRPLCDPRQGGPALGVRLSAWRDWSSSRSTNMSLGASMPSRTLSPVTRTTVMTIASPRRIRSRSRLDRTSTGQPPYKANSVRAYTLARSRVARFPFGPGKLGRPSAPPRRAKTVATSRFSPQESRVSPKPGPCRRQTPAAVRSGAINALHAATRSNVGPSKSWVL